MFARLDGEAGGKDRGMAARVVPQIQFVKDPSGRHFPLTCSVGRFVMMGWWMSVTGLSRPGQVGGRNKSPTRSGGYGGKRDGEVRLLRHCPDQPQALRGDNRLGAAFDAELAEDVFKVPFDRIGRDRQAARQLAISQAIAEQTQHTDLTG